MPRVFVKTARSRILILLWALLCIAFFIRYPASVSILHGSLLSSWPALGPKLARIDLLAYCVPFLRALLGLLIFCIACVFAGAVVLPRIETARLSRPGASIAWFACLGTAFIVGQGLLSVAFLTLAEFNQFKPSYVTLTLLAAVGIGLRPLGTFFSRHPVQDNLRFPSSLDVDERLIVGPVVTVALLALLYATSRLSYDSVALYFSDAKLTAITYGARYFVDDSFVVSIFHTGMPYAALIQLFGDQAARMYSWASGLMVMLFSLALADRLGLSKKTGLVLLAMIVTSTAITDLMGDGKIDLASTAPAIAAVYWMVANSESQSKNINVLIGFLAGLAMAERPFNIFLMGAVIGLFLVQIAFFSAPQPGTRKHETFLRATLWITLGALPWLAYHLASNWIILGDPIAFIRNYQKLSAGAWQWSFPPNELWLYRLIYPFTVTYSNTPQSLGSISPIFLGFLPLLFLKTVRNRLKLSGPCLFLIVAAGGSLVLWILVTFMVFEIRYVIFLWIILFIPVASLMAAAFDDSDPFLRNGVRLALLILLAFTAVRIVYISVDTYSPVDSRGNAHCTDFDLCDFFAPVNQAAPPGARVLTLNAFRYYLRTDLFACSTTHSEYSLLENLSRSDNISFWTEVYREGYQFVLYEQNYGVRHLRLVVVPGPSNAPPWLSLEPLFGAPGDPQVAYRIRAINPPTDIQEQCIGTGGMWHVQSQAEAR